MVHLCDMDTSKIGTIKNAAKNVVIHNKYPGYNCQDYILELLGDLEKKNIINKSKTNYKHNKKVVQSKQEGLV
ncbi:hypothetical protein DIZ76_015974 [Coccidioides immitis]|nr:hypothetical protein DIZ76_015974 [Coccidioides immitis]